MRLLRHNALHKAHFARNDVPESKEGAKNEKPVAVDNGF
jgi:hypothetical protein